MTDTPLPIQCPKCGHEFDVPTSRIKDDADFVCPSCGDRFQASVKRASREKLDEVLELDRTWDNFGKPK